jgi:integrase
LIYKSDRFTKPREDVDSIALSENDLKDILHFDLSATPHLDRVRDLFLVACHTGLRYSDFSKLTAENVRDGFIEIARQQKTGKPVVIPVHPTVKAIIKKYGGDLPESVSNQKMNEYIKDACKQVDCMKEYTTKTATKGGVKVTHRYKKWQVTSTHTGRRTFATNAYRQGIPTITIMAVTGHKTEKAFLSYIKVSPREHAEIMAAHWAKRAQMKIAN